MPTLPAAASVPSTSSTENDSHGMHQGYPKHPEDSCSVSDQQETGHNGTDTEPLPEFCNAAEASQSTIRLMLKTTVSLWRLGSFVTTNLPVDLSQSRIEGLNGSSACTVISLLTSQQVLTGNLTIAESTSLDTGR